MTWKNKYYPQIVIGLGLSLIFLSGIVESDTLGGPGDWLTEWTEWATNYVAVAVAAYSIVKLANGANTFLINWKSSNQQLVQPVSDAED